MVVVTGLGRILTQKNVYRKYIFLLLKLAYKDTLTIVLNFDDYRLFKAIGFRDVEMILGEGYSKRISNVSRNNNEAVPGTIDLIYVGRLLSSKGVGRLLDGFEKLSLLHPNRFRLVLVGDSDFQNSDAIDREALKASESKLGDALVLAGFQSDFSHLITSSSIFVSLSAREGMPFSVLEMLDAGVPCILSRVPGHKEFAKFDSVCFIGKANCISTIPYDRYVSLLEAKRPDITLYEKREVVKSLENLIASRI